ncbi:MAG: hypothetical protein LBO79_06270 [Zoogloeaceae bacterium]|nr:hypothetical protein [Zoogloeaceae bacterium]
MSILDSLRADARTENFTPLPDGAYFPREGCRVRGTYVHRNIRNGIAEPWREDSNLVTEEGYNHILDVALGIKPKVAGYYFALFSGAAQPASTWTAGNFTSIASENVSLTEGYTQTSRQLWVPFPAANSTITNFTDSASNRATFTFATQSSVTITGSALLSSPTRGGSDGVLVSASRYAVPRVEQEGDTLQVGYSLTLTLADAAS